MSIGGMPPARLALGPQKPDDDARLRRTAIQMEGLFVQRMFGAMRDTVSSGEGLMPQSSAQETFTQLLDEKLAEQVPAQFDGAHSLANALYHQLRQRIAPPAQESTGPATPT
jgi:flagellar protein FlgJ